MDHDIKTLQRLAGIGEFTGYTTYKVDENPSITATALKAKEKKMGVKPGDKDWFKLWFGKPFLTGVPNFRGRKKK